MATITSDFDGGNIRVVDAADPKNISLQIEKDGAADFYQWFCFSVADAKDIELVMNIGDLKSSSYPGGWENYNAAASYDGERWFRVPTTYADGVLTINHTPEQDEITYAYFANYPTSRYRVFVDEMRKEQHLKHGILGQTLDGQNIDYFSAGSGPVQMWVIARQHPGESMGSWWIEGFLPALAGDAEASKSLRDAATIYVIPCMNLDGSRRGHLRTNAAGIDLNRAWRNTTMEKSPEVYLVREKMRETGVDFFLDVHGDEAIANNFLDDAQGIPSWNDRHATLFEKYSSLLLEKSKDFQTVEGYPTPAPGKANLDIANNYNAETWGSLAITLEMPFKDAKVNPMPEVGWSPERCREFGVANLEVMAEIAGELG